MPEIDQKGSIKPKAVPIK